MKILWLLIFLPLQLLAQTYTADPARWKKQSNDVTIIRDHFGIPHIYGKTDADAVFGLMYAQCEDDYQRVERNYMEKFGLLSTLKGEAELYNDLLIKMIIDTAEAKRDYQKSPAWLKKLCNAWADGINYYLFLNPKQEVLIKRSYEPWFPFLWTDGSIGAINTAGLGAAHLK